MMKKRYVLKKMDEAYIPENGVGRYLVDKIPGNPEKFMQKMVKEGDLRKLGDGGYFIYDGFNMPSFRHGFALLYNANEPATWDFYVKNGGKDTDGNRSVELTLNSGYGVLIELVLRQQYFDYKGGTYFKDREKEAKELSALVKELANWGIIAKLRIVVGG